MDIQKETRKVRRALICRFSLALGCYVLKFNVSLGNHDCVGVNGLASMKQNFMCFASYRECGVCSSGNLNIRAFIHGLSDFLALYASFLYKILPGLQFTDNNVS